MRKPFKAFKLPEKLRRLSDAKEASGKQGYSRHASAVSAASSSAQVSSRRGSTTSLDFEDPPHRRSTEYELGFGVLPPVWEPVRPKTVPYEAAMRHHQELVDGFIAQAYRQAPTALPRNEVWATRAHQVTSMMGYSGGGKNAKRLDIDIKGPAIFASGSGCWVPGGKSMSDSGEDCRGARLYAAAPGLEHHGDLEVKTPNTRSIWHYRRMVGRPSVEEYADGADPSTRKEEHFDHCTVSVWECKELGRPGSAPAAVSVLFILHDAKTRKLWREHYIKKEGLPLYHPPPSSGVTAMHVALVKSVLTFVDADHIPPRDWELHWHPKEKYLICRGADVQQQSWIRDTYTVFYGLPEARYENPPTEAFKKAERDYQAGLEPAALKRRQDLVAEKEREMRGELLVRWGDGGRDHEAVFALKHDSELKECDLKSDLVVRTVWTVSCSRNIPRSIMPSEIEFVNRET